MAVERPETRGTADVGPTLFLNPACRELRRALGPTVWMVLEEVAFEAAIDERGLVSATSARRVAEQLGLAPGTAATALRRLRDLGLLEHGREGGSGGRFGLSVYRLHLPSGISLRPRTERPDAVQPRVVEPGAEDRYMMPRAPGAARARGSIAAGRPTQLSLIGGIDNAT